MIDLVSYQAISIKNNCLQSERTGNMRTIIVSLILLFLSWVGPAQAEMRLSSTDLQSGKMLSLKQVFKGFGCEGENLSPQLSWSGAPEGTKSFAITVYDPDAPTGSGWWHWTAFNIPRHITSLAGGADLSKIGAIEARTDYGSTGFGGACPPPGDKAHRYLFRVYALSEEKLPLDASASGALVGYYILSNSLGMAEIIASYQR